MKLPRIWLGKCGSCVATMPRDTVYHWVCVGSWDVFCASARRNNVLPIQLHTIPFHRQKLCFDLPPGEMRHDDSNRTSKSCSNDPKRCAASLHSLLKCTGRFVLCATVYTHTHTLYQIWLTSALARTHRPAV